MPGSLQRRTKEEGDASSTAKRLPALALAACLILSALGVSPASADSSPRHVVVVLPTAATPVERFAAGAPVRLMITNTGAEEWVDYLRARLQERVGAHDVPVVRSGAVLTAHVGLGSVSVAVRRVA